MNNVEDNIRQLEKAIDQALSYSQSINELERELELLKGRAGASQVTRNRHEAIKLYYPTVTRALRGASSHSNRVLSLMYYIVIAMHAIV